MADYRYQGSKYDKKLSLKEIAKLVRKEIKEAQKKRKIPVCKVSVRVRRANSLNISITDFPFQFLNVYRVKLETELPRFPISTLPNTHPAFNVYTPIGEKTINVLTGIAQKYNFDDSDSMTDYFHVNFYCHVDFDWELTKKQKAFLCSDLPEWPDKWDHFF